MFKDLILKPMLKKIAYFLLVCLLLLITVLLFNTLRFQSKQDKTTAYQPAPALPDSAIAHFQNLVRFKTISYDDSIPPDSAQFLGMHRYLQQAYPLVHAHLQREIVSNYSLIYHWKGADTSLRPLLLLAHMDVVPVEASSLAQWKVDPFSGVLRDGFIWGRGTYDNKVNMASILETVEKLLQQSFQPRRPVYIVFSHDEELSGKKGTTAIASLFAQRGIRPELAVDEGGIVTHDKVPGIKKPVALVGLAEKGFLTLQLEVQANGGHSSMPEPETAVDILARALVNIRQHPFEARLAPTQQEFINYLGPELPFVQKMAFANTWLFKKMIIGQYEKKPVGNAMMRTTVVPTIIQAGVKENVVPTIATAVINLRLLTGDSSKQVVQEVKNVINDKRVNVKILNVTEASVYTNAGSAGYKQAAAAIHKTFPHVIVTPFLLIGGTDSRHFQHLCNSIVRFTPAVDPTGNHGINECMSIDNYRKAVWYYETLIRSVQ
jgi:carboxypeptidase PM20D1